MSDPALHGSILQRGQALLGLMVFILLAFGIGRLLSLRGGARPPVPWRAILWGVALQFVFAMLVLWTPEVLKKITQAIDALLGFTRAGADMVFGNLSKGDVPVVDSTGQSIGIVRNVGYFAFFVLPTIIFFSALTAIAYHIGIMQYIIQALAWVMSKTMKASGAETLSAAANIFVGQTEAPLMIRPFVALATRSELCCIMVAGFANIASGVLGYYTILLRDFIHDVAGHLAAACLISAPASILVSKLLVPETQTPVTSGGVQFEVKRCDANLIDAAARGTSEGLTLALNVGAMLIAFTALVALVNGIIAWASVRLGYTAAPVTLQSILSYPFAPLAWLSGVAWADAREIGSLLGIKTVLNELLAYLDMHNQFMANRHFISPRSAVIGAYALCGFANFASIGIQVGGISTLAPERRKDLSQLGLLAMAGGAIASLMTASVVAILL